MRCDRHDTLLGGESPLLARQGEQLAGRQGPPPRGGVRRKRQAKRCPDEQKPHKRRMSRMRSQISSKSDTCMEGSCVDAAGISAKVGGHYPGRSASLPRATAAMRRRDGGAEVSRGHSRPPFDPAEGPNIRHGVVARASTSARSRR